jgi:2-C-methyl-D-erythritol 4-phosphate cytidylyltransferase
VIRVLEGDYDNVKITTSDDLVLAEQVATWRVHVTPEQGMHHV